MILVNMHEAKTRLSELVKRVESTGETVILCRNGREVAEVRAIAPAAFDRTKIKPAARMHVEAAPGYDPAEPLDANEWPEESR
jgi:prevent-host-death family protein